MIERIGRGIVKRGNALRGISQRYSLAREVASAFGFLEVRPGFTFFDVGANVGNYSLEVRRRLGPTGGVFHLFEPSTDTAAALEQHIRMALPEAVIVRKAVGEAPGEAVLYTNKPLSGIASLYKRRLDHHRTEMDQTEAVQVVSLDAYCRENGVAAIDLLKLDIEGNELAALQGAAGLLAARGIRVIQFEFGGCNIDSRTYFQDFFYFFKEYGYGLYRVNRFFPPIPITRYREELEQFTTTNYLAVAAG